MAILNVSVSGDAARDFSVTAVNDSVFDVCSSGSSDIPSGTHQVKPDVATLPEYWLPLILNCFKFFFLAKKKRFYFVCLFIVSAVRDET